MIAVMLATTRAGDAVVEVAATTIVVGTTTGIKTMIKTAATEAITIVGIYDVRERRYWSMLQGKEPENKFHFNIATWVTLKGCNMIFFFSITNILQISLVSLENILVENEEN